MADCGHDWFAFALIPNGPALATAAEIFIRHAGELPRGLAPIRPGRVIARVCSPRVPGSTGAIQLERHDATPHFPGPANTPTPRPRPPAGDPAHCAGCRSRAPAPRGHTGRSTGRDRG